MTARETAREATSRGELKVRGLEEAIEVMDTIDWTFSSRASTTRGDLLNARKYHWYPATFIPELPYTVVEVLTLPGASVYDPFAGIGTTIFQTAALGRQPFGTEICRVAVKMVRALWTLISVGVTGSSLSLFAEETVRSYEANKDYCRDKFDGSTIIEDLRPWYSERTLNEIGFLLSRRVEWGQPVMEAAGNIALSATLKAVSAQDRGWGCVADNMLPKQAQRLKYKSALDRFARNLRILERDIKMFRDNLEPSGLEVFESKIAEEVVEHADARIAAGERVESGSFDLVLTSPPYPEMTDYCTAQRLSYYSLGSKPKSDLIGEVGARRRRFRQSSLEDYRKDMKRVTEGVWECLRPGGYLCLVMPHFSGGTSNHLRRGEVVERSLEEIEAKGFIRIGSWRRLLPSKRRHHNQKWTSLTEEVILLFQKTQG